MHGAWMTDVFEPFPLSILRRRVLPTDSTTPSATLPKALFKLNDPVREEIVGFVL